MAETVRDEYVTFAEAARLLGVSRFRMSRLAKREGVQTYWAPDDKRKKWLRWEDIVLLAQPRQRVMIPSG